MDNATSGSQRQNGCRVGYNSRLPCETVHDFDDSARFSPIRASTVDRSFYSQKIAQVQNMKPSKSLTEDALLVPPKKSHHHRKSLCVALNVAAIFGLFLLTATSPKWFKGKTDSNNVLPDLHDHNLSLACNFTDAARHTENRTLDIICEYGDLNESTAYQLHVLRRGRPQSNNTEIFTLTIKDGLEVDRELSLDLKYKNVVAELDTEENKVHFKQIPQEPDSEQQYFVRLSSGGQKLVEKYGHANQTSDASVH